MATSSADYLVYDVFTDVRFGGNQLAVFPDATKIPEDKLQAVAREFNFSEVTFVYPPENPAHSAKVRIFTPTTEVPFAGHPTIGTAIAFHDLGRGGNLILELGIGPIPCTVNESEASFTTPVPLSLLAQIPVDLVAQALGLTPDLIETRTHMPVQASLGLPFVCVELTDRQALRAAHPQLEAIRTGARSYPAGLDFAIFCYVRRGEIVDARMFAPLDGITEDPATGSACATLMALLAAQPNGPTALTVSQGVDMGRPSSITLSAGAAGITVGGTAIRIMAGRFFY
jgi:trans-2,3-dihydro-3-hydroxyanthranilate isomerase